MRIRNALLGVVCLAGCLQSVEAVAQDVKRSMPPVGAVVGFALTAEEVKKLAPEWLPADGRTVNDPKSPLNGRALPDMRGLFMLGVAPDQDASINATAVGGTLSWESDVQLVGLTDVMALTSCTPFEHEAHNAFAGGIAAVIDTPSPERACQHKHALGGAKIKADNLPLPPYRGVIFLVRAR